MHRNYVTDVWQGKHGGKNAQHFETIHTKEVQFSEIEQ